MKLPKKVVVSMMFMFAISATLLLGQNGQVMEKGYLGELRGSPCSGTLRWSTIGGIVSVKGLLTLESGGVVSIVGEERSAGSLELLVEDDPFQHKLSQADTGGQLAWVGDFLSLTQTGDSKVITTSGFGQTAGAVDPPSGRNAPTTVAVDGGTTKPSAGTRLPPLPVIPSLGDSTKSSPGISLPPLPTIPKPGVVPTPPVSAPPSPATGQFKPLTVFQTGERFTGLDEEIFPLGWSEDGERLGLLRAQPNEAGDERFWKVEVLDLVEDRKVLDEEIRHRDEGGVAMFWGAHGSTVEKLLVPHQLRSETFVLRRFPALLGRFRGDSYETSLVRVYGQEPNFGYRGLSALQLTVNNGSGKSKSVFKKSWKEWYPLAAGVVGYLPNPQGDRIAIVLGLTQRGYESAPHVREVVIVGARVGEKF